MERERGHTLLLRDPFVQDFQYKECQEISVNNIKK